MNATAAALTLGLVLVAAAGPVDAAREPKVIHVHEADEFDVERALEALTVGLAEEAGLVIVVVQPTAPSDTNREAPTQQQQQTQSQQNAQVVTQNVVVRGGASQTLVVHDAGSVGLTARSLSEEPTRVTLVVKDLHTGDVINQETFFIGDDQQHLNVETGGKENVVVVAQTQEGEAALNVAAHKASAEQDSPEIEVRGKTVQDNQLGITDDSLATEQSLSHLDDSPTIEGNEGPVVTQEDSRSDDFEMETFSEDFTAINQETAGDDLFSGSSLRSEGPASDGPTGVTSSDAGGETGGLAGLDRTLDTDEANPSIGSSPYGGVGGLGSPYGDTSTPYSNPYSTYDTSSGYDTYPSSPTYPTGSGLDPAPTYRPGPTYETSGSASPSGASSGYDTLSAPGPAGDGASGSLGGPSGSVGGEGGLG